MQMMRMEVIMPMMHVMVITNPEVAVEMHMVVGIERVVTYPQMEMVMREDTKPAVVMRVIKVAKVVVAITRAYEPMHMEASHIDYHAGAISDYRSPYDNGSKQDSAS